MSASTLCNLLSSNSVQLESFTNCNLPISFEALEEFSFTPGDVVEFVIPFCAKEHTDSALETLCSAPDRADLGVLTITGGSRTLHAEGEHISGGEYMVESNNHRHNIDYIDWVVTTARVRAWTLPTTVTPTVVTPHLEHFSSLMTIGNEYILYIDTNSNIRVHDTRTCELRAIWELERRTIVKAKVTRDGSTLVVEYSPRLGDAEYPDDVRGSLCVYNINRADIRQFPTFRCEIEGAFYELRKILISPNGLLVCVDWGNRSGLISVFSLEDATFVDSFSPRMPSDANDEAWSPDSTRIAVFQRPSGRERSTLTIWSVVGPNAGLLMEQRNRLLESVFQICWPDERTILAIHLEGAGHDQEYVLRRFTPPAALEALGVHGRVAAPEPPREVFRARSEGEGAYMMHFTTHGDGRNVLVTLPGFYENGRYLVYDTVSGSVRESAFVWGHQLRPVYSSLDVAVSANGRTLWFVDFDVDEGDDMYERRRGDRGSPATFMRIDF